MVSKIIKRTPTKSIRNSHHCLSTTRNLRRSVSTNHSPIKCYSPSTSVVIATINQSFFTCRRRLVKIFSKLAKIATPKRKTPKKQGFIKLKKSNMLHTNIDVSSPFNKIAKPLFFGLPPLENPDQKTVFLDLDETLIHSKLETPPENFDFIISPVIDGEVMNFYVLKRPGVDELLEFLGKKYEVVVFTAGLKEYASLVLDELDKKGVINHRLYRDSCREKEGRFVKDLSCLGRDLWKVVLVDDNPNSYAFQPENAIRIKPFIDNLEDNELVKLIEFFEGCDDVKDIREAVKLFGYHDCDQLDLIEI